MTREVGDRGNVCRVRFSCGRGDCNGGGGDTLVGLTVIGRVGVRRQAQPKSRITRGER